MENYGTAAHMKQIIFAPTIWWPMKNIVGNNETHHHEKNPVAHSKQ
jgi:hypothetical protein